MQALAPPNNGAARNILGVGSHFNVSGELRAVQSQFNICVQTYYCKCIVTFLGHCFHHSAHPVTKLLSLPLTGSLDALRPERPRDPSGSAQAARQFLSFLGVQVERLVVGRPDVRGHSGYPFRWVQGWFEEVGDGSPRCKFQKHDKCAIRVRINLFLGFFRPRRGSGLPALMDAMHAAISDAPDAPV